MLVLNTYFPVFALVIQTGWWFTYSGRGKQIEGAVISGVKVRLDARAGDISLNKVCISLGR